MRTGALAQAPAAFPSKRGLTLERFGGAPKPAPQQQQRSGSILPVFLLRPGALARRRKLAFRAPQKQQRSGSILPPFLLRLRAVWSPPKAGFPTKPALRLNTSLPFTQGRPYGPRSLLELKNRIRKECQQFLGFDLNTNNESIP